MEDKKFKWDDIKDRLFNQNRITDAIVVLTLIIVGLIDFAELNINMNRLMEPAFWSRIIFRYMLTVFIRFLYMRKGLRNAKRDIIQYVKAVASLYFAKEVIEENNLSEQFDIFAREYVDVLEMMDDYEEVLVGMIRSKENKSKYQDEVTSLRKKRENLRLYRIAFQIDDVEKMESIDFNVNDIYIAERTKVTADALYDGTRTSGIKRTALDFSETKAMAKINAVQSISLIGVIIFGTIGLDELFFKTDNLLSKGINFAFTVAIAIYTMNKATENGKNIAIDGLRSLEKRLRYIKIFLQRHGLLLKLDEKIIEHREKAI